ncbi:MAG TPA: hypothetical protein VID47_03750, partial [Actinomycetota bacterium]
GYPISPDSVDVAGFYTRTARAIHRIAPGLLTIYVDWQSVGNSTYFALTRKPRIWNSAYSYEFYGASWDARLQARFDRYAERAQAWGLPGWIDEFDAFGHGRRTIARIQQNPNWARETTSMLAQAKADRIGWSFLTAAPMDPAIVAVLKSAH